MMDANTDPNQVYTQKEIFESIGHTLQCVDTAHHAVHDGSNTICCFNAHSGPECYHDDTEERTSTFVLYQSDYELVLPVGCEPCEARYRPTGVRHEAFHFEVSVQEIARYFKRSQLASGAAKHVDFNKPRQIGLALLAENCGLAVVGHRDEVLSKVLAQLLLDVHANCVDAGHAHYTLVAACSEYTNTPSHRLDFLKVTDLHNSCVYTRADTGGYLKTYYYEEPTNLTGVFTETGWIARIVSSSSDSGSALKATDSSDSASSCTSTLSAGSDIAIDLAGLSTLPTPARTESTDSRSLRLPLNDRVGKWVASQPPLIGASPQYDVPPPSPGPPPLELQPLELQLPATEPPRPCAQPPAAADAQPETICQGAGEAKTSRALLRRTDHVSAPVALPKKPIQAADTGAAAATVAKLPSIPGVSPAIQRASPVKKAIQPGAAAAQLKRTRSPSASAPTPAQRPRPLPRTRTIKQRCLQRATTAAAAGAPTATVPATWDAIKIKQEPKNKWAPRGSLTDQKVDETNGKYVQRQLLLPTNKQQQILHIASSDQSWRDATATEVAIVPGVPAPLQDEVARIKDITSSSINYSFASIAQAVEVPTTNAAVQHSSGGKVRPLQCKQSHRRARVGLLEDAGTEYADLKALECQLTLLANGIVYAKISTNDALKPWVAKHQQVARLIQELRARRATEL